MGDTKGSIDLDVFIKQIEQQKSFKRAQAAGFIPEKATSSIFVAQVSPQIGYNSPVAAPDFNLLEFKKDGLDNLYIVLNWKIKRSDGNSGNISHFKIYKRFLSEAEYVSFIPKATSIFGAGYTHFSNKTKRTGKFSEERKSNQSIDQTLISLSNTNQNLNVLDETSKAKLTQLTDNEESPSYTQGAFEHFLSSRQFVEIGKVDYNLFLESQREKKVFIQDRDTINFTFNDKNVSYGQTVEYYIAAVTSELSDEIVSDGIRTSVFEDKKVSPPVVSIKQSSSTSLEVITNFSGQYVSEKISEIIISRQSLIDDEFSFTIIKQDSVSGPSYKFTDDTVKCGEYYVYRIYLKNVFGFISEPAEIKWFSSVQAITPETRSNTFKIPIFSAVPDQNSNFIKINIFPNDPLVSFYILERRDLSSKENDFSTPPLWKSNSFFLEKNKEKTIGNDLNTKISMKEISFIDDTIIVGRIYQYRICGSDLFENRSSYVAKMAKTEGKKSLRSPININYNILRDSPFRIKLSWANDNILTDVKKLFEGTSDVEKKPNQFLYQIQRRKSNKQLYESFPVTANNFIIDEVPTGDFVAFQSEKIEDTYTELPNRKTDNNVWNRPFELPYFLIENSFYYYRVKVMDLNKQESNFSQEIKVSVYPRLSTPLNFKASVLNTKIKPLSVGLFWDIDPLLFTPDHWVIERKIDNINDSFTFIGSAYLQTEFFDRDVEIGNTYLYRIKSVDLLGRESAFFETRITL